MFVIDGNLPIIVDLVVNKFKDKQVINWCTGLCECKDVSKIDITTSILYNSPIALCNREHDLSYYFPSTPIYHIIILNDCNNVSKRNNDFFRLIRYLDTMPPTKPDDLIKIILFTNNRNFIYPSCYKIYYMANNNACNNPELMAQFINIVVTMFKKSNIFPNPASIYSHDECEACQPMQNRRCEVDLYKM